MVKKDWGDIPSLEGLEMDWGYKAESALGQRNHARLGEQDLIRIFNKAHILVKVATMTGTETGSLHDISEGGLAVNLASRLEQDQQLKVGLLLGNEKIISRALVRHVQQHDKQYTAGLMFLGLGGESKSYLAGVYAAKVLKQDR